MSDPVEDFLNRLHHPSLANIDLGLERMQRLLMMLGSPHKRLPPVIHVAGTNGKGSLLAYLQAVFEAANYRVHKYTSPHLMQFRERIVLQGKFIEQAYLHTLLKHLAAILPQQPVTFFEATTALAFLAFADVKADVLLLETGMGGRLDATNVIEKPLLTAITPISFDHMEYLGDTIEKIAQEKAGIMKKNVPCVIGRQRADAAAVLEKKAEALNVPLYRVGKEWHLQDAVYQSPRRRLTLAPSLAGRYQYENAATAAACVDQLSGFTIGDEHITQGISGAVWPARLQHLTGRLAQLLPPGMELWLDGGHNPQGGEVLAEWLQGRSAQETYLVCGMMGGKDASGYLAPLKAVTTMLYALPIEGESQSRSAAQLQTEAQRLGIPSEAAKSIENTLQTVASRAKTPATICICGSLYLAGKALAADGRI